MLTSEESSLLGMLSAHRLNEHLDAIASFNRRSGSAGEAAAREYVRSILSDTGLNCIESTGKGILGFGGSASLTFFEAGVAQSIPAKAWNFSGDTGQEIRKGDAVFMTEEDFPSSTLEYLVSRDSKTKRRDLEDKIVFSAAYSPHCILDAEDRGALGFVVCWPNKDEECIHHSGSFMGWGTPQPEEADWFPSIPILAISGKDAHFFKELLSERRSIPCGVRTSAEEAVHTVPCLETVLPASEHDTKWFLLIGAHLDSKYLGATDNASGAAVALSVMEVLSALDNRRAGIRTCWWSGHEFGRYTGSSLFARENFRSLYNHCLAYTNIDMPGMRGSECYRKITVGPDLFPIAAATVHDITGQEGVPGERVRAWDQSFQNMGVSSYFIWASTLAETSALRTGRGSMPWWWHTEYDTLEFCDRDVLFKDAQLYLLAVWRLLNATDRFPDPLPLWEAVSDEMRGLVEVCPSYLKSSFCPLTEEFLSLQTKWKQREEALLGERIPVIRTLNRIYLSARTPYQQDWGGGTRYIPGIAEGFAFFNSKHGVRDAKKDVIMENYIKEQFNRIYFEIESLGSRI